MGPSNKLTEKKGVKTFWELFTIPEPTETHHMQDDGKLEDIEPENGLIEREREERWLENHQEKELMDWAIGY